LNERQVKMLNGLLGGFEGKLTPSKWAKVAGWAQQMAYREILDLIERAALRKHPAGGRSTSYSLIPLAEPAAAARSGPPEVESASSHSHCTDSRMSSYTRSVRAAARLHRFGVMFATALWAVGSSGAAADETTPSITPLTADYTADGRATLAQLSARYETLAKRHGWRQETIYAYPDAPDLAIRAWRTAQPGPALWLIAGIHGEEPAGPNAIAEQLDSLVQLAGDGVPIVLIPMSNPKAYRSNWRYPNTPERDWRQGGYSVGDSEYLLPDLEHGTGPRAPAAPGPETLALTRFVLRLAKAYPPLLVLDLHEDELSNEGGYIYSQGGQPDASGVGAEIIRLLQDSGIPIRMSGRTRFDEPIVDGVISRDENGAPIRDGSIDELLASATVFVDGTKQQGPAAPTVIVVETPAFAGSKFELRVQAQGAVVRQLPELWALNGQRP
jgi:hypothetical protein